MGSKPEWITVREGVLQLSLDKHIGHRDIGGLAANQDFIYIIIYKLVTF